jgi:hypothetical protein
MEHKYIKYKIKYQQLKNTIGGTIPKLHSHMLPFELNPRTNIVYQNNYIIKYDKSNETFCFLSADLVNILNLT